MFKKMKLGTKVYSGFGLVLFFVVVLGVSGWRGVQAVGTAMEDFVRWSAIDMVMNEGVIHPLLKLENGLEIVRFSPSQTNVNNLKSALNAVETGIGEWAKLVAGFPELERLIKESRMNSAAMRESVDAMAKAVEPVDGLHAAAKKSLDTMKKDFETAMETIVDPAKTSLEAEARSAKQNTVTTMLTLTCIGALLGLFLAWIIARGITGPIHRAIAGLLESAGLVSSAAGQVSSASRTLAEGSSEQAASIEETSSSLEEMSSMTRQNADNANQASAMSNETKTTAESCSNTMQELVAAIGQVNEASQETQKIVKTIDEIAFQTNLLALNAAVEAARAGEAGAGFAVVADEVRNLAMRAAEAARNTTTQIDDIGKKINDAMEMAFKSIEEFVKVDENTGKVSGLVAEINAASNEQAQGIEQLNQAVAELDKVVQQNAANAEESASASQELQAQSVHIKAMIDDLSMVVYSNETNDAGAKGQIGQRTESDFKNDKQGGKNFRISAQATGNLRSLGNGEVRPDEIIPMEEKDFRNL